MPSVVCWINGQELPLPLPLPLASAADASGKKLRLASSLRRPVPKRSTDVDSMRGNSESMLCGLRRRLLPRARSDEPCMEAAMIRLTPRRWASARRTRTSPASALPQLTFPTCAARRSWRSSGVRLSVPPPRPSKAHLTREPAPALRISPAPLSHLPPSHAVDDTGQVSSSWSGRLAWIMPTCCLTKCLQGKLAVVPVIMCIIAGSQDEPTSTMCGMNL